MGQARRQVAPVHGHRVTVCLLTCFHRTLTLTYTQSIGVRPEVGLARGCGLELGPRGGIKVDEGMRTSDPHIWAVGDAVEVKVRRRQHRKWTRRGVQGACACLCMRRA